MPALAQVAEAQAVVVAENILRAHHGDSAVPFSPPRTWPSVLPIGGKMAIASVFGLSFRGNLAYMVRKIADLRYFLSILPPHYAFHVFMRGAKVYLKND